MMVLQSTNERGLNPLVLALQRLLPVVLLTLISVDKSGVRRSNGYPS